MKWILWTREEKPCLNHWYRMIRKDDFLKIVKDYYNEKTRTAYYKIVEYRQGDILRAGLKLVEAREIMREVTYRRFEYEGDDEHGL